MNKEQFLIKLKNRLRVKFKSNREAAQEIGISESHLSNTLRGRGVSIPEPLLIYMKVICCDDNFKELK